MALYGLINILKTAENGEKQLSMCGQEMPQPKTTDQPTAASSLFLGKTIAKLERSLRTISQKRTNKEPQHTMGATINQQQNQCLRKDSSEGHWEAQNILIFTQESAVAKTKYCLSRMEAT